MSLGACSASPSTDEEFAAHEAELVLPQAPENLVELRLPAGRDVRDTGLVAAESLSLRDRSTYQDSNGVVAPLHNVGTGATELGVQARSGPVHARGTVSIRNDAVVTGDVLASGAVTREPRAVVSGTVRSPHSFAEARALRFPAALEADPTKNRTVGPDAQLVLAPGSYGNLVVNARSRVRLSSGNYAFSDIRLEADSVLEVAPAQGEGPVAIYTHGISVWRGTLLSLGEESAKSAILIHRGTSGVRFERPIGIAFVAPNARAEFATGGVPHHGSVYARDIWFDPDVRYTYVPFEYWDWILPPRPFVSCVLAAGQGRFMAAFGYENQRDVEIEIAAGENNRFVPSGRNHPVLEVFESGEHPEAVWVDMPEAGVTWSVFGQEARATTSSPPCSFEHSTVQLPRSAEPRSLPGAHLPPTHAPSKVSRSVHNLAGAGRLIQRVSGGGLRLGVVAAAGIAPGTPIVGLPPDVTFSGPRPDARELFQLSLDMQPSEDGAFEKVDVELSATVGSTVFSRAHVGTTADACATPFIIREFADCSPGMQFQLRGGAARGTTVPIGFQFFETNNFSSTEYIYANYQLDVAAGRMTGTVTDRGREASGIPPVDHTFVVGEQTFHRDDAQNVVRWRLDRLAPPDGARPVQVCLEWPAVFTDETTESVQGRVVPNSLVRGYPASYARYEIVSRAALAQVRRDGFLDREGCVPGGLRADELAYFVSQTAGGLDGGLELFARLYGEFRVPGEGGGQTVFTIRDAGGLGVSGPILDATLGPLTSFDDVVTGWPIQGGFRVPPNRVALLGDEHSELTNVGASLSQILKRLDDGQIRLPSQEFPVLLGGGALVGSRDLACREVQDSFYTPGDLVTGVGERIEIGPAFFPCDASNPKPCVDCASNADCPGSRCDNGKCVQGDECRRACATDAQCPGGQACMASDPTEHPEGPCLPGSRCFCGLPPQGSVKNVTTHEMGHLVQTALAGEVARTEYWFKCPSNGACGTFGKTVVVLGELVLENPPGMASSCECDHVTAANGAHCLQSIEVTPEAQGEGFAQFFAAYVWNAPGSTCTFNYYKEFLDDACRSGNAAACVATANGVVTSPPVAMDCNAPYRWRNRQECAISATQTTETSSGSTPVTKDVAGTELDWMAFLRELESPTLPLAELMNVYRYACSPTSTPTSALPPLCGASTPIFWLDGVTPPNPDGTGGGVFVRAGFVNGVERRFGLVSQQADRARELGRRHGVNEEVAP